MTPEGKVKDKLKKFLASQGDCYQFWPVQGGFGASTVDCLACRRGRWIGIECKKAGVTKPTPRQGEVLRQMRAAGAITWLVTADKDTDELIWIRQE